MKIVSLVEDAKDDFQKHLHYIADNHSYVVIKDKTDLINAPLYAIPYKLKDIHELRISETSLRTLDNIPDELHELFLYKCNGLTHIDLSKVSIAKDFQLHTSRGVESIILPNLLGGLGSFILIEQCLKIHKISSHTGTVQKLTVKNCKSINSLTCIDVSNIINLNLEGTNNITHFDKNNISADTTLIHCDNIKSFRGVEDVDIRKKLTLTKILKPDNIICSMLTNASILIRTPQMSGWNPRIEKIFKKYSHDTNRRNSIMDVAIELIDDGYSEAAEL